MKPISFKTILVTQNSQTKTQNFENIPIVQNNFCAKNLWVPYFLAYLFHRLSITLGTYCEITLILLTILCHSLNYFDAVQKIRSQKGEGNRLTGVVLAWREGGLEQTWRDTTFEISPSFSFVIIAIYYIQIFTDIKDNEFDDQL